MLITKAAGDNNWKLADKVAKRFQSGSNAQALASTYNSIAWRMSGEKLDNKAINLSHALDISKKSLEIINGLIDSLALEKLVIYKIITPRRYKKELKGNYAAFADTYALLLYKKGDTKRAFKYQQIAAEVSRDNEIRERLLVYKAGVSGNFAVMKDAETMVKEGRASETVIKILKRAWLTQNNADGWDNYMAELQKESKLKQKEEWKKKMENYAAPRFIMKNMAGKEVSLESLAGNVVVVDFWATWCVPCHASFPGMQKAQDIYKDDAVVKFVYVDTWENNKPEVTDKLASDFIAQSKYSFHVLMDYDNKVVESFGINSIPTKFIIDKKGNVRFRVIGYSGSDQKVVDEMTTMIDIVKELDTQ